MKHIFRVHGHMILEEEHAARTFDELGIGSLETKQTHIGMPERVGIRCTSPARTSRQRTILLGPSILRKSWEIKTHMDGSQRLFLRYMKGLEGHAAFETFESKFNFTRCIYGSARPPRSGSIWQNRFCGVEEEEDGNPYLQTSRREPSYL